MPPTIRSLELLEEILAGQPLTPAGLDDLVQNHPDENQHIDFKDGLLMNDVKKARAAVRQNVSAFANATGGTLIVGVNEPAKTAAGARPPRAVSQCIRPGGQPLDEWATRVLADMAPYLSPPPRIQVVPHGGGEVLLIAAARAPRLVPVIEDGQLAYYVRLHETTVKAHDWLISDLVLGRRSHPTVELSVRVEGPEAADPILSNPEGNTYPGILFWYVLDVVNASLVSADYVDAGVVTWSCTRNGRVPHRDLLTFVDVGQSPGVGENPREPGKPAFEGRPPAWQLQHMLADRSQNKPQELRPFVEVRAVPTGKALYPLMNWGECEVTLAAYVMPKGAPPTWFEVVFRYERRSGVTSPPKVTPMPLSRPSVGWHFLG